MLTGTDRTMFDQCATQIDALNEAVSALAGDSRMPKGSIRVAASAGLFDFFEIAWAQEFLDSYPAVQLEFVLSDGSEPVLAPGSLISTPSRNISTSPTHS